MVRPALPTTGLSSPRESAPTPRHRPRAGPESDSREILNGRRQLRTVDPALTRSAPTRRSSHDDDSPDHLDHPGPDGRPSARSPGPGPVLPAPVSRRSVLLLAASVGLLATVGLLYVLADRPDLREPLEATATIIGSLTTAAGVLWTISRALRHR